MKRVYIIYALRDPTTDQVRYIGCTRRSLTDRLHGHMSDVGMSPKKESWIRSLRINGMIPVIETIDEKTSISEALKSERQWIRFYGEQLLNVSRPNAAPFKRKVGPPSVAIHIPLPKATHQALVAAAKQQRADVAVGTFARALIEEGLGLRKNGGKKGG